MHEFEQLVNDGLKELPVHAKESRILPHDVHDVAGNHSLVIFPLLHLAHAKKILDHSNEKGFLMLLLESTAYRSNGPAEGVQIVPAPLCAVNLTTQLNDHCVLGVERVEMCQEDKPILHGFIKRDGVGILQGLLNDLTILIFHNENLLGAGHLSYHHMPQLGQNSSIVLDSRGHARTHASQEQLSPSDLVGVVKVFNQGVPVLQANLPNDAVVHPGYHEEILQRP
mmetsp:Transcript_22416/g.35204  ORF Transcript_22416/g.35204 Transcript_22416/m.35204 type:complete len:225 (-) Transcript_22416:1026-1700(-)